MKKTLEFTDKDWPNALAVAVSTEIETQNDSDLIFESVELLLGFVRQRAYEDVDDYNDRLHGVINLCREKIYEDSEGAENGRM